MADRRHVERQVFGVTEPRAPPLAEGRAHPLQLAAREPVGKCEHRRSVDADNARVALLDDRFQRQPLLVSPQLGLRPASDVRSRRSHRTARFEDAALRGAAERNPLDALRRGRSAARRALVEEHVDRAAARREGVGRDERREHWIFVVLTHRHDPHVDAVLAHQRRKEGVEPLAEPLLLHRRLIPKRAERMLRRRLRGSVGGQRCAEHSDESEPAETQGKRRSEVHNHEFYDGGPQGRMGRDGQDAPESRYDGSVRFRSRHFQI